MVKLIYNKKIYKLYKNKEGLKYINVKQNKVYLNTIKGKYKYIHKGGAEMNVAALKKLDLNQFKKYVMDIRTFIMNNKDTANGWKVSDTIEDNGNYSIKSFDENYKVLPFLVKNEKKDIVKSVFDKNIYTNIKNEIVNDRTYNSDMTYLSYKYVNGNIELNKNLLNALYCLAFVINWYLTSKKICTNIKYQHDSVFDVEPCINKREDQNSINYLINALKFCLLYGSNKIITLEQSINDQEKDITKENIRPPEAAAPTEVVPPPVDVPPPVEEVVSPQQIIHLKLNPPELFTDVKFVKYCPTYNILAIVTSTTIKLLEQNESIFTEIQSILKESNNDCKVEFSDDGNYMAYYIKNRDTVTFNKLKKSDSNDYEPIDEPIIITNTKINISKFIITNEGKLGVVYLYIENLKRYCYININGNDNNIKLFETQNMQDIPIRILYKNDNFYIEYYDIIKNEGHYTYCIINNNEMIQGKIDSKTLNKNNLTQLNFNYLPNDFTLVYLSNYLTIRNSIENEVQKTYYNTIYKANINSENKLELTEFNTNNFDLSKFKPPQRFSKTLDNEIYYINDKYIFYYDTDKLILYNINTQQSTDIENIETATKPIVSANNEYLIYLVKDTVKIIKLDSFWKSEGGGQKYKYKGKSYKIRIGSKGGKFILVKDKKIYI